MVEKKEDMKKTAEEEINQGVDSEKTESNYKTENQSEDTSKDFTKTKIQAEKLINDIIIGIQDKSEEFGKAINDYKRSLQKPLTDVFETEYSIVIKIDLPGVKKEDIDLEIAEDSIEIKALFEDEIAEETSTYLQKERSHGKIIRSLTLPTMINAEQSKADFKDGILTVDMPKIEKEVHKVNIN
ncbi:Hsp20/alpha crystallin family protein [Methanobacterium alcaliphilum]|uniref:Hsp20/alpha crystallin family protein n=1 Tax=Methanobacterium alcaliphilum TaxID=392018 RepID=UPI00200ADEFA|nr:Hsp20/alpha crystallin family protein [Methanobacterium alcaliphilum]MCK9151782.1 Hsp20/alpha crystallin family protein [Methanobacterium alcaliphilum]